MGRYAQARRRGSGAAGTNPAPPPLTVTDVHLNAADSVIITFSDTVTFVAFGADANFLVNGTGMDGGFQLGPTTIQVSHGGSVWNVGDPWDLQGQPSWLLEVIPFPSAGLVT